MWMKVPFTSLQLFLRHPSTRIQLPSRLPWSQRLATRTELLSLVDPCPLQVMVTMLAITLLKYLQPTHTLHSLPTHMRLLQPTQDTLQRELSLARLLMIPLLQTPSVSRSLDCLNLDSLLRLLHPSPLLLDTHPTQCTLLRFLL